MRPLILSILLLPSIALAQFDCKPSALPNGESQSGDTFMRVSAVGAFAAWRCKSNGSLQMAVVRHDYISDALRAEWDAFRRDPSHQRMNQMLAAHKTGDWHTDPKLVEVWQPWATQLQALK